jgi:hypothetical protein
VTAPGLALRIRILGALLGLTALAPAATRAAAEDTLVVPGRQLGNLVLRSSLAAVVDELGPTPLIREYRGVSYAYWESLGFVAGSRDGHIVYAAMVHHAGMAPEAQMLVRTLVTREGVRIGDSVARVEQLLGRALSVGPARIAVPGVVTGTLAFDRWVYVLSRLMVDFADGQVVGFAVSTPELMRLLPERADTRVVAGERLGPWAVGEPSDAIRAVLGRPIQRVRRERAGVVLEWRTGLDILSASTDTALYVDRLVARRYLPSGRVVGEFSGLISDRGLRIGDTAARVGSVMGPPRWTRRYEVVFGAAHAATPVLLEEWNYDGVLFEIREGLVWGVGVRERTPKVGP